MEILIGSPSELSYFLTSLPQLLTMSKGVIVKFQTPFCVYVWGGGSETVGEEDQVVYREKEYHGCWEEHNM